MRRYAIVASCSSTSQRSRGSSCVSLEELLARHRSFELLEPEVEYVDSFGPKRLRVGTA